MSSPQEGLPRPCQRATYGSPVPDVADPTDASHAPGGVPATPSNRTPQSAPTEGSPSWPTRLGRLLAIGVMIYASYLLLVQHSDDCATTTTTSVTGSGTTTTTVKACTVPGLSDLTPLFAVAGLLILHELSELSIPGILSLKRRVNEQADALEDQGERLRALHEQVQEVRVSVGQTTSVRTENHIYANPQVAADEARARLQPETPQPAGAPPPAGADTNPTEPVPSSQQDDQETRPSPAPSDDGAVRLDVAPLPVYGDAQMAVLAQRVLSAYSKLEPFIAFGRAAATEPDRMFRAGGRIINDWNEEQRAIVLSWYRDWAKQLRVARDVRNAVAHPPASVTAEDLQATSEILELLAEDLDERLGQVSHAGAATPTASAYGSALGVLRSLRNGGTQERRGGA